MAEELSYFPIAAPTSLEMSDGLLPDGCLEFGCFS
jgi:hypothetical protein